MGQYKVFQKNLNNITFLLKCSKSTLLTIYRIFSSHGCHVHMMVMSLMTRKNIKMQYSKFRPVWCLKF